VSAGADPVDFCGLELAHPIINASGTFDVIAARRAFGDAVLERFPFSAYVSKTITPAPRAGNAPPRLWEEAAGMVNSIGLPNKGTEGFLEHDLPVIAELPVPLMVSIMATSAEEFAGAVEAVAGREEVAAIELNVSCPNVHSGLIVGEQPSETEVLMRALRPLTPKPLIVKLTPNVAAPALVAAGAEAGGADAVSLINTLKARPMLGGSPWLGNGSGGLSGPAVRTVALQQVADVVATVAIPVVGMGGVEHGSHARDLLDAGAALVAVGTASFRDPLAAERIRSELGATRAEAPAPIARESAPGKA
jgi:dihydroorotate dehydrogenase (NAD+) catalytic subunit